MSLITKRIFAAVAIMVIASMGLMTGCTAFKSGALFFGNTSGSAKTEAATEAALESATENALESGTERRVGDADKSAAAAKKQDGGGSNPADASAGLAGSAILGAPTADSITVNVLAEKGMEVIVEYGKASGTYNFKSEVYASPQGEPVAAEISGLLQNTEYFYRLSYRLENEPDYTAGPEYSFYTQRASGSAFTFGVQGDSHPERTGNMFSPDLYMLTMQNAVLTRPDFYFTLGDDFSIEKLISSKQISQESVNEVYQQQRMFLGIIGTSSPLFLVNGNHEQAAKYLLDSTPENPAVYAALARVNYYPLPVPGDFYSGDSQEVENIGLLRDYYAFEWGDALFAVIDPYWHSDVAVDNTAGVDKNSDTKTKGRKDLWDITLGDTQYQWFKQTLESSDAKYKFVFTHHVLGTGRGGIENAESYEWGGFNGKGAWEFDVMRPGWEMPIHDLMVKNGVTIFFQGHDHLFARQELDGVIYQSVPNPADDTYTAFNEDAYKSGDILPNSGFLKVTVSPEQVKVDYILSFLPGEETNQDKNGGTGFSYVIE